MIRKSLKKIFNLVTKMKEYVTNKSNIPQVSGDNNTFATTKESGYVPLTAEQAEICFKFTRQNMSKEEIDDEIDQALSEFGDGSDSVDSKSAKSKYGKNYKMGS